jgi:LAGLIDADG endonuclease
MLEHPSIRWYSLSVSHLLRRVGSVSSENPSGADNQQETVRSMLELDPLWVVGFVDGEGCFSVSIHRNANAKSTGGWQLHPVFHVYQHERYRPVLEALVDVFGCGRLRPKGPASSVWTFAVDSLRDIDAFVLPFFELHQPVVKAGDFDRFSAIVRATRKKEHLTTIGFERLIRLAYEMNFAGKQRSRSIDEILMGSSETARQAPVQVDAVAYGVKIQSDPHGDMGSQAEMT